VTPNEPDACGPDELVQQRARWASGWRQAVFPGIFLFYLAATANGIEDHSGGWVSLVGYVVLALFASCYIRALPQAFGGGQPGFWRWYLAMVALFLVEIPIAHEGAFVMITYIAVLTFSALGNRAIPVAAGLVLLATFGPAAVPSWHTGVDTDAGVSIALVSLAMYGFFQVIRANRALSEARAEVARLATESERSRIARDLHDLLGHSLTTITVKAGLARRLSASDPDRAAGEIAEVEALARRSLADVRTAVSSYREVTLTGELASGRELLRAAGLEVEFPGSTDVVRDDLHELFGWVVREGLTNVVRHARASGCRVTLTDDSVEILDDGLGGEAGQGGAGLVGLRERVAAAGGTVEAGPTRQGWRLRVEVPALVPVVPHP
jgi:two-component system sensor histidine kinase DesK